jgi:uncharacterized protein YndB with AHSA1/START domain
MADILHEVVIEVGPDKVYQALTEQARLANWWTANTKAEPKVGAMDEFKFNDGQFLIKMEVTGLEPGKKVSWNLIQGVPDWEGTRVTWDLTPDEHGTKVLFGHLDFASTQGSFASASYNWAYYLTSMKAYLETGKGTPNPG